MSMARFLIDPPTAGATNMAVDEALLLSAGSTGQATLRFYTWKDATLSLGYFQTHVERATHPSSAACPLVRRASGGGAIVHHHELTYSFVVPLSDRLSANAEALYYTFHETLIDALGALGIETRLCDASMEKSHKPEPFLCFERRATGDVLCGDYKVTGSAQRRHAGAVLQHGSVLLMKSEHAPELPGIAELSARVVSTRELVNMWTPGLARRLEVELSPGALTEEEFAAAATIEAEKFGSDAWTQRR